VVDADDPLQLDETVETYRGSMTRRQLWLREIQLELYRWRRWPDGCSYCGERIGHRLDRNAGSDSPCSMLAGPVAHRIPLEEVRPGCFTVRRHWIGDAIRAACEKRST
jgi:hypothetical protein